MTSSPPPPASELACVGAHIRASVGPSVHPRVRGSKRASARAAGVCVHVHERVRAGMCADMLGSRVCRRVTTCTTCAHVFGTFISLWINDAGYRSYYRVGLLRRTCVWDAARHTEHTWMSECIQGTARHTGRAHGERGQTCVQGSKQALMHARTHARTQ